jgi:hypothetical protein
VHRAKRARNYSAAGMVANGCASAAGVAS